MGRRLRARGEELQLQHEALLRRPAAERLRVGGPGHVQGLAAHGRRPHHLHAGLAPGREQVHGLQELRHLLRGAHRRRVGGQRLDVRLLGGGDELLLRPCPRLPLRGVQQPPRHLRAPAHARRPARLLPARRGAGGGCLRPPGQAPYLHALDAGSYCRGQRLPGRRLQGLHPGRDHFLRCPTPCRDTRRDCLPEDVQLRAAWVEWLLVAGNCLV
mmetsp:Transcript_37850/g.109110  ORF Transcript_37850/g.109110 Transcript_37850/m.109110 type:complete len:214 (-) Transcript_37850:31-672(-)